MKLSAFVSDREMQRAVERAVQLMNAGRAGPAWRLMRDVDVRRPNNFDVLHVWGSALVLDQRFEDGIRVLSKAAAIKPDAPAVWMNIAGACRRAGKTSQALEALRNALRTNPNLIDASHDMAMLLLDLGRIDEAAAQAEGFVARFPSDAETQLSLGVVRTRQGRIDEAIEAFMRAAEIAPNNLQAKANLGFALASKRRFAEAAGALKEVVAKQPANLAALEKLIFLRRTLCDWEGLEDQQQALIAASEQTTIDPWTLFAITDDAALQKKVATRRIAVGADQLPPPLYSRKAIAPATIRVAYIAANVSDHSTARAIADLIETHDKSRIEPVVVSFAPLSDDAVRNRLAAVCKHLIDAHEQTPEQVAKALAGLDIDIAVDLSGPPAPFVSQMLALRPAPVQVASLAYPGTSAAPWIDYLLADATTIPPGDERHVTESVVRLPDTALPPRHRQPDAATGSRRAHGLPESAIVFAAFANTWKITPALFEAWMEILRQVSGSVLWLRCDDEMTARNLTIAAEKRGIGADRIVIARHLDDDAEHLARLALADIVLDTTPYAAQATTADALWAGVPVVSAAGNTVASRMSAAQLRATGLDDLITSDIESYSALATTLAADPARRAGLKSSLIEARTKAPAFDLKRYCANLEAAYTIMRERTRKQQPHAAITVQPPTP